jgi:hypothetical protein
MSRQKFLRHNAPPSSPARTPRSPRPPAESRARPASPRSSGPPAFPPRSASRESSAPCRAPPRSPRCRCNRGPDTAPAADPAVPPPAACTHTRSRARRSQRPGYGRCARGPSRAECLGGPREPGDSLKYCRMLTPGQRWGFTCEFLRIDHAQAVHHEPVLIHTRQEPSAVSRSTGLDRPSTSRRRHRVARQLSPRRPWARGTGKVTPPSRCTSGETQRRSRPPRRRVGGRACRCATAEVAQTHRTVATKPTGVDFI